MIAPLLRWPLGPGQTLEPPKIILEVFPLLEAQHLQISPLYWLSWYGDFRGVLDVGGSASCGCLLVLVSVGQNRLQDGLKKASELLQILILSLLLIIEICASGIIPLPVVASGVNGLGWWLTGLWENLWLAPHPPPNSRLPSLMPPSLGIVNSL